MVLSILRIVQLSLLSNFRTISSPSLKETPIPTSSHTPFPLHPHGNHFLFLRLFLFWTFHIMGPGLFCLFPLPPSPSLTSCNQTFGMSELNLSKIDFFFFIFSGLLSHLPFLILSSLCLNLFF